MKILQLFGILLVCVPMVVRAGMDAETEKKLGRWEGQRHIVIVDAIGATPGAPGVAFALLSKAAVLAEYTGRLKYERRGGGYHYPIQAQLDRLGTHICENGGKESDPKGQEILKALQIGVDLCNKLYGGRSTV